MGNIHDSDVLNPERIASQYNQYFENISPVCTVCEGKFACKRCLFHIEGVQGDRPQCNDITNNVMFENMVSSVIARCKRHPYLYLGIMKQKFFK
jgi:hypothetical protein